jgi:hypothetical protein
MRFPADDENINQEDGHQNHQGDDPGDVADVHAVLSGAETLKALV